MIDQQTQCPHCNRTLDTLAPSNSHARSWVCKHCGAPIHKRRRPAVSKPKAPKPAVPRKVQTPFEIPGYQMEYSLGKGGMASVYRARHAASGRAVAIKILNANAANNPDLLLRFEREAEILASLSHPNVVQIMDRGQTEHSYFMVMEYIPGATLKHYLGEGLLPVDEIAWILTRIGEATQYCHDHGLVHRDLKPGNVLLTFHPPYEAKQSGCRIKEVKVADFGISGLLRRLGDITEQGVLIGTPQYVAPEQLRDGSRIDHRADQFSLAVLAYEMITNSLPVGIFEPASSFRKDLEPSIDTVIHRALSREPTDRYQSVREFIYHFRKALAPTESQKAATSEKKKSQKGAQTTPSNHPSPTDSKNTNFAKV